MPKGELTNKNVQWAEESRIRVIGVGTAGCRMVDRISAVVSAKRIRGIHCAGINVEVSVKRNCAGIDIEERAQYRSLWRPVEHGRVPNGRDFTAHECDPCRVQAARAQPRSGRGRIAAQELREKILDDVKESKLLLIAGLGGTVGSEAAPEIAQWARESGNPVAALVTMPMLWEGKIRAQRAEVGLEGLRKHCRPVTAFYLERMRHSLPQPHTLQEAYCLAQRRLVEFILTLLVNKSSGLFPA